MPITQIIDLSFVSCTTEDVMGWIARFEAAIIKVIIILVFAALILVGLKS